MEWQESAVRHQTDAGLLGLMCSFGCSVGSSMVEAASYMIYGIWKVIFVASFRKECHLSPVLTEPKSDRPISWKHCSKPPGCIVLEWLKSSTSDKGIHHQSSQLGWEFGTSMHKQSLSANSQDVSKLSILVRIGNRKCLNMSQSVSVSAILPKPEGWSRRKEGRCRMM